MSGGPNTQAYIISDSRGRGLIQATSSFDEIKTNLNISLQLIVKPGAKLEELLRCAEEKLLNTQTVQVAIIGGICDLTNRTPDRNHLRYNRSIANINNIKTLIRESYVRWGAKLNIATIYPASLSGYAEFRNTLCTAEEEEQSHLIEDIDSLNEEIIAANKRLEQPTIDLNRILFSFTKKKGPNSTRKRKFLHRYLSDGVHPTETTQVKCATRVAAVLKRNLTVSILEKRSANKRQLEGEVLASSQESGEEEPDEATTKACKRARR